MPARITERPIGQRKTRVGVCGNIDRG